MHADTRGGGNAGQFLGGTFRKVCTWVCTVLASARAQCPPTQVNLELKTPVILAEV